MMSYYNTLSMGLASMFVRGLTEIAELVISVRRIEGLLLSEEFVSTTSQASSNEKENGLIISKDLISMKNVFVKWNKSIEEIVLNNIILNVKRGSLVGVIGPVGCGKSALLQTILGKWFLRLNC